MATPSGSLATLRPDLGGSMEEFNLEADRLGFIGIRVAPVLESAVASGIFGRRPVEELLRNHETKRAPRAAYGRGNEQFEQDTFATQEHGWEEPVDDNEAAIYGDFFDAELSAARRTRDVVVRGHERRVAALCTAASIPTGRRTAAASAWNTGSPSPIDDIWTAREAVFQRTGIYPDSLAINRAIFHHLRNTEQVLERISSQGAGDSVKAADITAAMLARVFDLREVMVAGGAQNTAQKGQAAAISHIWTNDSACLFKAPMSNAIEEPCFIRTIHFGGDGSSIGGAMENYRDEKVRGDVIRCRFEVQEKVMYAELAELITGIYQEGT